MGVPEEHGSVEGVPEAVANDKVPAVTVPQFRSAFTVTGRAPPQSSFTGGVTGVHVLEIVKSPVVAPVP